MEILKNPTSKLLFITAELYQERSIDDAQKRSLKGKHCHTTWRKRELMWFSALCTERIFLNDKNLIAAANNITDV